MIEGSRSPACGGVAEGAIGGETGCDVVGIGGPGEVRLMARVTGGWRRRVVVVGVALRAGDGCMRAGERVIRVESVVELGIEPVEVEWQVEQSWGKPS